MPIVDITDLYREFSSAWDEKQKLVKAAFDDAPITIQGAATGINFDLTCPIEGKAGKYRWSLAFGEHRLHTSEWRFDSFADAEAEAKSRWYAMFKHALTKRLIFD